MNKKSFFRDAIIIGFAIFAIYFGAGNLIFPPQIGLVSGTQWPIAILGMVLAGIALPLAAVIGVSNAGGTFAKLTDNIAPWFATVYSVLIMFGIGTLITIPRTGAVAYEMGMQSLAPSVPKIIFIVAYFAIAFYFANDKSNVIDKVGKVLTPILLLILVFIVVVTFVKPIGSAIETMIPNAFYNSFTTSYQTGDILTGLLCAPIFIAAVRAKGYTERKEEYRMTMAALGIAFLGLLIVYGGLLYLGASGNSIFPADTDNTVLLIGLVETLLGKSGMMALSVAVSVACLTTAIGLIATVADFINRLSRNKISYRMGAAIVAIINTIMALLSVQQIINLAGPIFFLVYPISIVITFLGIFIKYVPNKGAFIGTAIMTIIPSIYDSINLFGLINGFALPQGLTNAYMMIPFASQGFAWIVPAIIGFIVGGLIYKYSKTESKADLT